MIDGEIMKIDQASIMKGLDWAYDQAVNGSPVLKSAEDLGNEYKQRYTAGTDSLGCVCSALGAVADGEDGHVRIPFWPR